MHYPKRLEYIFGLVVWSGGRGEKIPRAQDFNQRRMNDISAECVPNVRCFKKIFIWLHWVLVVACGV